MAPHNLFLLFSITHLPTLYIRYFQCQPKHGLFAPIHKVAKVRGKPPPRPSNSDLVTREKRSSSTSSLSSMGSTTSGIARNTGLPPLDSNSPRSQDASRRSGSAAPQYMKDSEENLDSLKSLVESADKEKVELLQQLEEERRLVQGSEVSDLNVISGFV